MAASNLAVRLATAAVGIPVILAILYKAPPVAFFGLAVVCTLVAAYELFTMTHPGDRASQIIGVVMSAVAAISVWLFGSDARAMLSLAIGIPLAGPLLTLFRLGDIKTAAFRATAMGFGPLFVGIPLTLLAALRRDMGDEYGPGYVIMTLMFAWLADTGGYFAGRYLGKHKLYEAVSPKKTVEGAIGGLAGSVVGGLLGSFWLVRGALPVSHAIPLALVASALGQAGDLGESLIKRSTGVKDSGAIIPGHGGILDRIDALLMTSTVVYLYTLWQRG